jgi:hypothetical protein
MSSERRTTHVARRSDESLRSSPVERPPKGKQDKTRQEKFTAESKEQKSGEAHRPHRTAPPTSGRREVRVKGPTDRPTRRGEERRGEE